MLTVNTFLGSNDKIRIVIVYCMIMDKPMTKVSCGPWSLYILWLLLVYHKYSMSLFAAICCIWWYIICVFNLWSVFMGRLLLILYSLLNIYVFSLFGTVSVWVECWICLHSQHKWCMMMEQSETIQDEGWTQIWIRLSYRDLSFSGHWL